MVQRLSIVLLLFVVFMCFASCFDRDTILFHGIISGTVKDDQGQSLYGVEVKLEGVMVATTTTNTRGEFNFVNLAAGNYVVSVIIKGNVVDYQNLYLGENEVKTINFSISKVN